MFRILQELNERYEDLHSQVLSITLPPHNSSPSPIPPAPTASIPEGRFDPARQGFAPPLIPDKKDDIDF